ncbi:MAG: L,D-transpeptidase, partial [Pseudolabrys sp.]|nr:L,D-transpeptidase [Pseudolabrys sp.]
MFRRTDLLLAALATCAASPMSVLTGPAWAQGYPPPGYYRDAPPAPGWYRMPGPSWSDEEEDDQPVYPRRRVQQYSPQTAQGAVPGAPSRITPDAQEADAGLPPPGLPQQQQGLPPQVNAPINNNPDIVRPPAEIGRAPAAAKEPPPVSVATLPPEDQPETGEPKELPPNLKRQLVDYQTKEPAGTLIVDTANTYLYLVLGGGKAIRYGVRVGREGFTWAGTERISKMKEWPDWFPPSEMIERQPYLPRFTAGGPGNPLGARAMYLGKTVYRIHGTNQPSTIGKFVSSGCVGMLNEDVED